MSVSPGALAKLPEIRAAILALRDRDAPPDAALPEHEIVLVRLHDPNPRGDATYELTVGARTLYGIGAVSFSDPGQVFITSILPDLDGHDRLAAGSDGLDAAYFNIEICGETPPDAFAPFDFGSFDSSHPLSIAARGVAGIDMVIVATTAAPEQIEWPKLDPEELARLEAAAKAE